MRPRILTLLFVMAAVFAIGARPASANHINTATVTADCTGYTITVAGEVGYTAEAAVNYTVVITPSSGTPGLAQTINDSIPIPNLTNGDFSITVTRTWADFGVTLDGTYCFSGTATMTFASGTITANTVPISFTPECITCQSACTGTIGDFVWQDSTDCGGYQDTNEPGFAGITVRLENGSGVIATTTTDANGHYQFFGLCAGSYTVVVDETTLPPGYRPAACQSGDPTSDNNCSPSQTTLLTDNSSDQTMDFGYCPVTVPCTDNCLIVTKEADKANVDPNEFVTYTYTVTNTGSVPITNLKIVDDNGTPDFAGDDFVVVDNVTLAAGATAQFTATVIPSALQCMLVGGVNVTVGTLSTQVMANGDVKVIFRQSLNVVDNTYGTNASSGWGTKGHTFSNLTGSDKAEFAFTNRAGTKVLDATLDYISASSAFPSGYGTLGVAGGDGSLSTGSAANILSFDTTFSATLNKPQFRTGYTVNSAPAPNADWEYVDGYTIVVSHNAFGTSGFGGVTVPLVHDSPSKLGQNAITPIACSADTTNTATVTGHAGSVDVQASDDATVHINAGTIPPPTCTKPDRHGNCKPPKHH